MAKIVVTGGAGFIGSNLCEELVEQGNQVVAIDNLSVSDVNVASLEKIGVKVVEADIANYEDIEEHFEGADLVFHLAAMNRAVRSIERPVDAHHANITGTVHVLEAMRKHKVPKIVFASSSSVYAGREGLLKEDNPVAPPHPYGVGKLAGEHYVRVYSELYGLKHVTLRFFSVYGPKQLGTIDKAGVVAKFIHQARNGKPLTINGDGSQQRNFTYVKDVVRCCIIASKTKEAEGHVINIANPEEITIKELAELVIKATKENVEVVHQEMPPGDPARNPADTEKSKKILNYQPNVTFEEGINKTIEWYDEEYL